MIKNIVAYSLTILCLASQFYKNIKDWSSHNSGGHFAAMEKPKTLAKDINKFVKEIL